MSWTDDRVATLTKLWNDGLSASIIAQRIGEVTRNAVIGKVHRLGLAGRRRAAHGRRARPGRSLLIERPHATRSGSQTHPRRAWLTRKSAAQEQLLVLPELGAPTKSLVTVRTLTAMSCRWPIGDPKTDGFHFCGRVKAAGCPYCAHHAAIAYRPSR